MDFKIDPLWEPTYNPGISDFEIPKIIGQNPEGFLFVDKPLYKTSHDIVSWGRRLLGTKKVGHAGTLDPAASGMLILGLGRATKFIQYLQGMPKTYTARIRFGQTTDTEDASGQVIENHAVPEGLQLDSYFQYFRGEYLQIPSSVSAKKVAGKRAYQLVREGKPVELDPVPVKIYELDALSPLEQVWEQGLPMYEIEILVTCSAGTYIRALARDLGKIIGVGAHLRALRRVAVGPYRVEKNCYSMSELANKRLAGEKLPLIGVDQVAEQMFPQIKLSEAELRDLSFGKMIPQFSVESSGSSTGYSIDKLTGKNEKIFAASFADSRSERLVALIKSRRQKGKDYWQPVFVWQPQIRQ